MIDRCAITLIFKAITRVEESRRAPLFEDGDGREVTREWMEGTWDGV
jgi:hypothetical protein